MTDPPAATELALSTADAALLRVFRKFLMRPGEMLCLTGPLLEQHKLALASLVQLELLSKERFPAGYSLTPAGYVAMRTVTTAEHGGAS